MTARGRFFLMIALEVLVLGVVLALVGMRWPGAVPHVQAAGRGVAMMAVLMAASCVLLDWGRSRTQKAFMGTLVGVLGGKFFLVGVAVAYVALRKTMPPLSFVAGLMGGWVAFSVPLVLFLHRSAPRLTEPGGSD